MTYTGDRCSVSSWGWLDSEGSLCLRAQAEFRLFSVRCYTGERSGFIAVPVDTEGRAIAGAGDALVEVLSIAKGVDS